MSDRVFLDTNILIYFYSEDELEKRKKVKQLLKANKVVISTQIMNEFSNVMLRKYKKDSQTLEEIIEAFKRQFAVINLTTDLTLKALKIHRRYRYSFWDSLVLSAALHSGCPILYTEDLSHNQEIENRLKIKNPFNPEVVVSL